VWSLFAALTWFWVGLWVVVLFENSIVCHLMKQTYCLNMNMNANANMSINSCCWCLLFVVVLLISLFFAC